MTSLKKSIAVLAVSLPLAASAQQAAAPAPLYQIYGTLNVNGQYVEISKPHFGIGTNATGRYGVSVDSSNIGIRGTADTGQFGLAVVYQCETSANVDGVSASGICNRNSRLGLSSQFGTLFYGNWDTPYKAAWYGTKADDAFGNTDIYDAAGLMSSPGFKTKSTAGSSASTAPTSSTTFAVRAANSIAYHSPNFEGVSFKVQYSTNENASTNGKFSGDLVSAAVNYDRGPVSVLVAAERHYDWAALNTFGGPGAAAALTKNTVDDGLKAGIGYELGSTAGTTTIGAVWEYLRFGFVHPAYGLAAGDLREATRQAFMVNLKHRMGNHEFRARYEYADNGNCKLVGGATCNLDIGMGAQNYALGYAYYLSKAAQVYAFATKIENERGATYTFGTGGPAVVNAAAWSPGADPFGAGIGLRYAF